MISKTAGQSFAHTPALDGNLLAPVWEAMALDRDDILEMHVDPRRVEVVIVLRNSAGAAILNHEDSCSAPGWDCCNTEIATSTVWIPLRWG